MANEKKVEKVEKSLKDLVAASATLRDPEKVKREIDDECKKNKAKNKKLKTNAINNEIEKESAKEESVKEPEKVEEKVEEMKEEVKEETKETNEIIYYYGDPECYLYISLITTEVIENNRRIAYPVSFAAIGPDQEYLYVELTDIPFDKMTKEFYEKGMKQFFRLNEVTDDLHKFISEAQFDYRIIQVNFLQFMRDLTAKYHKPIQFVTDEGIYTRSLIFSMVYQMFDNEIPEWISSTIVDINDLMERYYIQVDIDKGIRKGKSYQGYVPAQTALSLDRFAFIDTLTAKDIIIGHGDNTKLINFGEYENNAYVLAFVYKTIHKFMYQL